MLGMSADSLYYLNLAAQFTLVLMGVLLALRDAWVKRHPNVVLLAFGLVGAVAMFAAVRQGQENTRETAEAKRQAAEANEKLVGTMDNLDRSTKEISRVQGLNIQLQQKLLGSSDQLLRSSATISNLSEQAVANSDESLKNITGEDSIPYIVPQTHAGVDPIPLMIWNRGKHLLTGVTVTIRNSKDYTNGEFLNRPELDVGVVHPGFGRWLRSGISPTPDNDGVDIYIIWISTQSELFTETLQFRKSKNNPILWAYRFWVAKQKILGKGRSAAIPVYDRSQWSDDLGEGKPTKP